MSSDRLTSRSPWESADGSVERVQIQGRGPQIASFGFAYDRQGKGSHEIWRHVDRGQLILVPHHSRDMPEGTLRAILRGANIDVDDFLKA